MSRDGAVELVKIYVGRSGISLFLSVYAVTSSSQCHAYKADGRKVFLGFILCCHDRLSLINSPTWARLMHNRSRGNHRFLSVWSIRPKEVHFMIPRSISLAHLCVLFTTRVICFVLRKLRRNLLLRAIRRDPFLCRICLVEWEVSCM